MNADGYHHYNVMNIINTICQKTHNVNPTQNDDYGHLLLWVFIDLLICPNTIKYILHECGSIVTQEIMHGKQVCPLSVQA